MLEKPVLMLLHGFLGSQKDWLAVSKLLSPHYRIVLPDLRLTDEMIQATGSDDFMGFCQQLFFQIQSSNDLPERFSILGYSLGGRVALAWANLFPDRFEHVILESCHPGLELEPEKQKRLQHDSHWFQRFQNDKIIDVLTDWYAQPVFSSLTQRQKDFLIQIKAGQYQLIDARPLEYLSLARQPSLWSLDENIPVSYLFGQMDTKFSAIAGQFSQRNKKLGLYQFEDCGHNVHHEKPEAFCKLVQQLLNETN